MLLLALCPSAASAQDTPLSPASPDIVGGQPAEPGEWPWQVAVTAQTPLGPATCGGSLIHPRWVLTAAHCVILQPPSFPNFAYLPPSSLTVVLGEHIKSIAEGGEQTRGVIQVVVHPGYVGSGPNGNDSDIALLELVTPATATPLVQLVRTATALEEAQVAGPGTLATATGWGDTQWQGDQSDVLREVAIPIVSNATCSSAYGPNVITSNMVCAGYLEGGKSSCQGDSGGPLVVPTSGGWQQVGIVSFGYKCAAPGMPTVFTRVSPYYDWIHQYIATPTGPEQPLNGTFESGQSVGWYEDSLSDFNIVTNKDLPIAPHSGSYVAWLGGAHNEVSRLGQVITLDERATSLRFKYQFFSEEPDCGYDVGLIAINGETLGGWGFCAQAAQAASWSEGRDDISKYAGQTVFLEFYFETDDALLSSLFLDDIAVETTPPGTLAITSFSPANGIAGSTVTVYGSNFLDVVEVKVGGVSASYAVQSDGSLVFTVPNTTSGPVVIRTAYAEVRSAGTFTVGSKPLRPLAIAKFGAGTGKVASTTAGIACGSDCAETYSDGAVVSLVAAAAPGSVFVSWGGACAGTRGCRVTMSQARDVFATFDKATQPAIKMQGKPTPGGTLQFNVAIQLSAMSSCQWDFGDGIVQPCVAGLNAASEDEAAAIESPEAISMNVSHVYVVPMPYIVKIIATNKAGTYSASLRVTVPGSGHKTYLPAVSK